MTVTVSTVRVWSPRVWRADRPLALAPAWASASSVLSVRDDGRLEFWLVLGVRFSMNTASTNSKSSNSASKSARPSPPSWPSAHRRSKRPLRVANSARREAFSTWAIGAQPSAASTAIRAARTAKRSAGGMAW
jgi:hypothetical protein